MLGYVRDCPTPCPMFLVIEAKTNDLNPGLEQTLYMRIIFQKVVVWPQLGEAQCIVFDKSPSDSLSLSVSLCFSLSVSLSLDIAIDCILIVLDALMLSHSAYGPGTEDQEPANNRY